jgi:energy-coupling factor transport system substrate-specific component
MSTAYVGDTPSDVAPARGAAPARSGLAAARGVALAAGAVALGSFFLPWVQYQQGSYSGFDLASAIAPALAGVRAGGLKGFHLALHAMPVLAIVTVAFLALGLRRQEPEAEARLGTWAGAAALAGLAIALLFVASALLPGTPGTQFAPGLVRTDAAVKATAPKALNAGDLVGVGVGAYLTIAGFAVAAAGSLFAGRRAAETAATAGAMADVPARSAWRTQDFVLLAVLAVVFGAIYWWWLQPYLWIAPLAAQVGQELVFGMWFVSGLLGGYIVRRPGAAFLAETMAALAEVLLGAPAGPILVVTGLMQALGPELVLAATGYRRWGWGTMLVAGMAAGLVALPWNWFRLGYFALPPGLLLGLLVVRLVSGALAGVIAKLLGDLLAGTGALNAYAIGRERMHEI